jgi:probable HAF family extracellular repeat protein
VAGSVPVRTVVWSGGRATDVGTLGGDQALPSAISENGEVIGVSKLASGANHPFSWQHGKITDLLPGGGEADVNAVNAAGDIVGTVNNRPALWRHGVLRYLAASGEAVAVNDRGQVTGVVRSDSGAPTVFRWTGGELTELPSLPGAEYQYPVGIDAQGRVVGNVSIGDTNHAVIWS